MPFSIQQLARLKALGFSVHRCGYNGCVVNENVYCSRPGGPSFEIHGDRNHRTELHMQIYDMHCTKKVSVMVYLPEITGAAIRKAYKDARGIVNELSRRMRHPLSLED